MQFKSILFITFLINFVDGQTLLNTRIIGGFPANLMENKHQVSIRLKLYDKRNFGNGFSCSGSLISDRAIVTAAHCTHTNDRAYSSSDFKVVLGTLYLNQTTNVTIIRSVSKVIIHPRYEDLENDIAIMILNQPIPLNKTKDTIEPIDVAEQNFPIGTKCQISGWGSKTFNGHPTNELQTTDVVIIDTKECNDSKSYDGLIAPGMICAGNLNTGGVDACQGDSGGPLVCNGSLAGIISWGYDCGRASFPGVYTDVVRYRKWILRNSSAKNSNFMAIVTGLLILLLFIR